MNKLYKIIALIPARAGSKRIPNKNILPLAGKPLISYTIAQAQASKFIDDVFVSTESKEIADISERFGAKIINRPEYLASDAAKSKDVTKHAYQSLIDKPDFIVLLQTTSPFRKVETIDNAIQEFIENKEYYTSLMPVRKLTLKTGTIDNNSYIPLNRNEEKNKEIKQQYYECGTIFIYKKERMGLDDIYGDKIMPFFIDDEIESLDIDHPIDFQIAEFLMKEMRIKEF